jgi:hypothetical protein
MERIEPYPSPPGNDFVITGARSAKEFLKISVIRVKLFAPHFSLCFLCFLLFNVSGWFPKESVFIREGMSFVSGAS